MVSMVLCLPLSETFRSGQDTPTGAERATEAELKARRLVDRFRVLGINPAEV